MSRQYSGLRSHSRAYVFRRPLEYQPIIGAGSPFPNAPVITSITAGNSEATVYFTQSLLQGNSRIINYSYSIDGGNSFTAFSPIQTTSPLAITGLTNDTTYNVAIKAINSDGSSAPSNVVSTTPFSYKSLLFETNSYLIMSPGIIFGTNLVPFTIEGWIYATYTPGLTVLLGSGGTGPDGTAPYPSNGLSVYGSIDGLSWRIDSSGVITQIFTFPQALINTWYYVAVTRDISGFVQIWRGTAGSGTATASTTGRVQLNNSSWNLTASTLLVGAWTNTAFYNNGAYINNLRVTSTARFLTTAPTIPVPSANFTAIAGTQLLINNGDIVDQSGTQTFTTVGTVTPVSNAPF